MRVEVWGRTTPEQNIEVSGGTLSCGCDIDVSGTISTGGKQRLWGLTTFCKNLCAMRTDFPLVVG